jgi:DNA-binding HxlR family transcriptional regulator
MIVVTSPAVKSVSCPVGGVRLTVPDCTSMVRTAASTGPLLLPARLTHQGLATERWRRSALCAAAAGGGESAKVLAAPCLHDYVGVVGAKPPAAALVTSALRERIYRFSELRRRVDGVSEKMLSQTLRMLEHDGLIARVAYPEVPPRGVYNLTDLGHEAAELLIGLVSFNERRMPQMLEAQQTYAR